MRRKDYIRIAIVILPASFLLAAVGFFTFSRLFSTATKKDERVGKPAFVAFRIEDYDEKGDRFLRAQIFDCVHNAEYVMVVSRFDLKLERREYYFLGISEDERKRFSTRYPVGSYFEIPWNHAKVKVEGMLYDSYLGNESGTVKNAEKVSGTVLAD